MDDEGQFQTARSGEPVITPAPDIVLGNMDVWGGPQAPTYMKTVLSTGGIDWFQSSAAGVDHPALQMVMNISQIYTTNHTQAEAMAEWALWQALDFLRRGPEHRAQQTAAQWEPLQAREIMDSHWLIIGFGSIGQAVARRVQALGGRVTGVRRTPGPADYADRVISPADVNATLNKADIVLLCTPLTDETASMADAPFFDRMREDALFMNLGRGGLVDEEALITALDAGRLGHAALDVTVTEPLPSDSPLWAHPKITLTPHNSSATEAGRYRADETFLRNLTRYLKGEPLENTVKPVT